MPSTSEQDALDLTVENGELKATIKEMQEREDKMIERLSHIMEHLCFIQQEDVRWALAELKKEG